jgi:hypothetical protein
MIADNGLLLEEEYRRLVYQVMTANHDMIATNQARVSTSDVILLQHRLAVRCLFRQRTTVGSPGSNSVYRLNRENNQHMAGLL